MYLYIVTVDDKVFGKFTSKEKAKFYCRKHWSGEYPVITKAKVSIITYALIFITQGYAYDI